MQSYNAVGIMSGTSLDGLDLVHCHFQLNNNWQFKILKSHTYYYNEEWKSKLSTAHLLNGIELFKLHKEYGIFIGNTVNDFLKDVHVKIDFIASHGHTVFHQPENRLTLQIGDGTEIASKTNITTINDFRTLDVTFGGQGAPLVPIGDELLFSEYDYCLNIGGFANISFKENNKRLAYDICPANIIINYLTNKIGLEYDKGGEIGKKGKIYNSLLEQLDKLEYYKETYPKSLGREWLEKEIIPLFEKLEISVPDQLATLYEHIAKQIAGSIKSSLTVKTLITGGGAYNHFLIEKIKDKTTSQIIIPDSQIIEYKEALVFAFLGLLRYKNQINCLSSVTGASKDSSSGIIHNV